MKEKHKLLLWNIIWISLGLGISGLGIALNYWVQMGSTTFSTFSDGLHVLLHSSLGVGNLAANLLLLVPVLVWGRDTIRMGTFLTAFTAGLYIDLFGWPLSLLPVIEVFWLKLVVCGVAVALIGLGLSLYVAANAGLGPVEAAVEILLRKTGWQYKYARWAVDAMFFGVGVALGGAFGVGTVINLVLVGVVMQYLIPIFEKLLGRHKAEEAQASEPGPEPEPEATK